MFAERDDENAALKSKIAEQATENAALTSEIKV